VQPTIRNAGSKDLAGLLTLYRELRPNDPVLPPDIARRALENLLSRADIEILVCEVDETLASTCMLVVVPNLASGARPFAIVEHVVTLSAHRRKGYSRLVLEHALARAWTRGCYKAMLLSGVQRVDAHKLYESVGFVGDVERGFVVKNAQTQVLEGNSQR
jgi:GNAT superfamily N-acetyltransferase